MRTENPNLPDYMGYICIYLGLDYLHPYKEIYIASYGADLWTYPTRKTKLCFQQYSCLEQSEDLKIAIYFKRNVYQTKNKANLLPIPEFEPGSPG